MNRHRDLDAHAFQALLAGKFLAMREHWMGEARELKKLEPKNPLVSTFATFARCAHHGYCDALKLALRYQRRDAERRAIRHLSAVRRAQ